MKLNDVHDISAPVFTDNNTGIELARYLDYLTVGIEHLPEANTSIGNEALGGIVKPFIHGIGNTFIHLANNVKTMFKSYKDFKRSDLRYFKESKHMDFKYVMSLDYDQIRMVKVPVPAGLSGPYAPALSVLNDGLTALDMNNRVLPLLNAVKVVRDHVLVQTEGTKISRQAVTNITNLFDGSKINKHIDIINKHYTAGKNTPNVECYKVFDSMDEFRSVVNAALEMETYLVGCTTVCKHMSEIEEYFQSIIDAFEKGTVVIVKDDLHTLVTLTRMLAGVFDTYGVWINDVNRTLHNLSVMMRQLSKIKPTPVIKTAPSSTVTDMAIS